MSLSRRVPPFDPIPWMELALIEAAAAMEKGEVPVGAVLVDAEGVELSRSHNLVESLSDPTTHAEINVVRQASSSQKSWRLTGSKLVVTLEPCPMCLTALSLARVSEIYFGCHDPRLGAAGSIFDLSEHPNFPSKIKVFSGVLEQRCTFLLKSFFSSLRRGGREVEGA